MALGPHRDDLDRTLPRTEDSAERGLANRKDGSHEPETYRDLGQSDELNGEDSSDIADEGMGHRG